MFCGFHVNTTISTKISRFNIISEESRPFRAGRNRVTDRVSIGSLSTSLRYLVTKTRCTWRLKTTLRPLRIFGSGVHRGDIGKMVRWPGETGCAGSALPGRRAGSGVAGNAGPVQRGGQLRLVRGIPAAGVRQADVAAADLRPAEGHGPVGAAGDPGGP